MILRGWKDICQAAGGMGEDTLRKLMREEQFPVTIVARKPMSTQAAISEWIAKRCQMNSRPAEGMPKPPEGPPKPN